MPRRSSFIIPARNWQRTPDPARAIAEAAAPKLVKPLAASLKHLRELIDVKALAHHLARANAAGAADTIPIAHFRETLKEPFDLIAQAFEESARAGAQRITGAVRDTGRGLRYRPVGRRFHLRKADPDYAFDRFDQETQRRLREMQDELITDLEDSVRDTIETMIADGLRYGSDMEEIAANIRDTLTLTRTQAQAVANYRRQLEDLDPAALRRGLRDTSFDVDIEDAIDAGDFLSATQIDEMVQAYADNYLDYRAATIAETESLRASNEGLRDSYRQAADRGVFDAGAVTRHWQIAGDERVCPICRSIVEMNPDGVGLNEDFQSSDGSVSGDPPLHPKCRCTVEYVTDLDVT